MLQILESSGDFPSVSCTELVYISRYYLPSGIHLPSWNRNIRFC